MKVNNIPLVVLFLMMGFSTLSVCVYVHVHMQNLMEDDQYSA